MKFIYTITVILFIIVYCGIFEQITANDVGVQGETVNSTVQICEPNSTKMKECNRCRCSANGRAWMCTRKGCPQFARKPIAPNEIGYACTPNKTFRYECNNCTCNAQGNHADCTNTPCSENVGEFVQFKNIANLRTTTERVDSDKCTPGTRWKQDCNHCWCTETGIGACTLRGCISHFPQLQTIPLKIETLKVERISKRQVNTQNEERIYTQDEIYAPNFKCTMKRHFKVECNTCSCFAEDSPPLCTLIACERPVKNPQRLVRQVEDPKLQENEKTVYTRQEVTDPNFKCTMKNQFRVECNTCWCMGESQVPVCTRMGCVSAQQIQVIESSHKSKRQTRNQNSQSQSKIYTQAEISDPNFKCNIQGKFKVDCNTCWCLGEDKPAVCTRMGCSAFKLFQENENTPRSKRQVSGAIRNPFPTPEKPIEFPPVSPSRPATYENPRQQTSTQKAETITEKIYTQEEIEHPNFRCTPSYSFKVECNTCWCSADGRRPRYCTKIGCKVPAYSTKPPPIYVPETN